jgi:hypothetical protein
MVEKRHARALAGHGIANVDSIFPAPLTDTERATAARIVREIDAYQRELQAYCEWRESTPLAERLKRHAAKREEEIRSAALDILTPDQQREVRLRDVERLSPPRRPPKPPMWKGDSALYCFEYRQYEQEFLQQRWRR